MPLQKQPVAINFTQGLDLKSDPFQVPVGKFLTLVNSIFTTSGRLSKRDGFENLTALPNKQQTILTTLNDSLIATGSNIYSYSQPTNSWINKGLVQPINLSTQTVVRASTSQTSPDAAVTANGLTCTAYMDSTAGACYQVSDSNNGEQIVARVVLPATSNSPRVFILGIFFIVTFIATVGGNPHIQFVAIPMANPGNPTPVADFSTSVASPAGYDGYSVSANNQLYVAWANGTGGISLAYMNSSLIASAPSSIAGTTSTLMSVTNDSVKQRIYLSYWGSGTGYAAAFNYSLVQVMAQTQIITATISEITSVASNNLLSVFYEVINNYGYDANIRTDFINSVTLVPPISGTGVGTVGSTTTILRSVGLASKAFIDVTGTIYMLVEYGDTNLTPATDDSNEPTYFLIDNSGNIYMRLAATNSGGYAGNQVLPTVNYINGSYYVPYLYKDFLATVNKGTNLPTGTPVSAIYTQTGVNLATFEINSNTQRSSEIAGVLNLTGGMLWEYDGVRPVENNFHVYPENVEVTTATGAGSLTAQTYFYVFTYEWTNNQGNLERSAPSIPVQIVTTTASSTNTIHVPTDRLTYKIAPNPIRIVGYRWSQAQQIYYQFTSLTSPTLNDTTIDYVTFTDTLADSSILGNTLLYTTGGVIEDTAAPGSIDSALFDNRLWLIDAEDQNLLWYSKQVIEAVPVEMSDLLTLYVAPTTSAQGSTGTLTAIYPMDDKLILFKSDAVYYINGTGPDNTGANSGYSQPIFVTASVGSTNPNSIVLIPSGLMFQSDKGIWLLGRDLSTNYIGAPVESFNSQPVLSATNVPGTTQARFILPNNVTLMYDYYFNQWGTHTNISAISSTLYQGKHTYLNSYGQIYKENPGSFVDGSEPVLMSLTTSWINVAGLQGFERFYFANLLGTYITPFKLAVGLAYDYNPSSTQGITVLPDNYTPVWGGLAQWGSDNWGASGENAKSANVFSARLFPNRQKCESFQVTIQEVYDPSFGVPAGEGLSISGLALIVGMKRGFRTQSAKRSYG